MKASDTGKVIYHLGEATTEVILRQNGKTIDGEYIYDTVINTEIDLSDSSETYGGCEILFLNNYFNVDDSMVDIEGYEDDNSTQSIVSKASYVKTAAEPYFILNGETGESKWNYTAKEVGISEFFSNEYEQGFEFTTSEDYAGWEEPWNVAAGIRMCGEYESYSVYVENLLSLHVFDIWQVYLPIVNYTFKRNDLSFSDNIVFSDRCEPSARTF